MSGAAIGSARVRSAECQERFRVRGRLGNEVGLGERVTEKLVTDLDSVHPLPHGSLIK